MSDGMKDSLILLARILLMLLFIIFGWWKLTHFELAVSAMQGYGAPLPYIAAIVAVVVELFFGFALILGLGLGLLPLSLRSMCLGHPLLATHSGDSVAWIWCLTKSTSIRTSA